MNHTPQPNQQPTPLALEQLRGAMRQVTSRQRWLWSTAVMVMLLLTLGIASFAFPGLLNEKGFTYTTSLDLAVRGLIALVLLFNVYVIYQQFQIQRIQIHLNKQIGTLDRLDRIEERAEQVYKIAALDGLTGLYNRQSGELRLGEEMARSQRHGRPLTVLMLDLNSLKQVNDTLGHPAGDHMLRYFAERLQSAVRGSDVPVRLGGDEFLVLLSECRPDEVHFVLNRMKNLSTEFEGSTVPLEFAAGWADYVAGESAQTLIARADAALYTNKRELKEKHSIDSTNAGTS